MEWKEDFDFASKYWSIVARCCNVLGDLAEAIEAERRQGRAFLQYARQFRHRGDLAAEYWFKRAFITLRQAKAEADELDSVLRELKDSQLNVRSTFLFAASDEEPSVEVLSYIDSVRGKDFSEMLGELIRAANFSSRTQLLRLLVKYAKSEVLFSFMGISLADHNRRVRYQLRPIQGADSRTAKDVDDHCWHMATTIAPVKAYIVEAIRRIICEEHLFSRESFRSILNRSAFVEEGREIIWAEGLYAGLNGDYLVSTHLLIPQIEHGLRVYLGNAGEPITKLDAKGIESDQLLSELLTHQSLESRLGSDFVFGLRGLLCEKAGSNLRNEVAHGLIPIGGFYQSENFILLAMAFSLLIKGIDDEETSNSSGQGCIG